MIFFGQCPEFYALAYVSVFELSVKRFAGDTFYFKISVKSHKFSSFHVGCLCNSQRITLDYKGCSRKK
ncbi:hypothetical protein ALP29_201332 [Pseudomonas syringae pv. avii]|uniref:Uncharacterized protein n=1 Tax=Pseudomonas syringae pv. avii TaxID=663959 RepID=A0A3M5VVY6_PSESX|nr:hypothetical protein ALP29_201332 [Pseudomonas syringae pv. avii]